MPPVIDGNKEIEIVAGGHGTATFIGQNVKLWASDTPPDFVGAVELNCKNSTNVCEVLVDVKDDASYVNRQGEIVIYAFNGAGTASERATLTVKVSAGEKYATPTIDKDENVTVMQGGTASAIFTGQHTRRWACDIERISQDIRDIDLDYSENPAQCEIKFTLDEDAKEGTYTIDVYAFNAGGQPSEPKTLTVNIKKNADHEDAVIDGDESVSITHGGTATAVFTGSHARTWGIEERLPSWINGITFDYNENSDRCRVTVVATSDSSVKAGEKAEIKIYAYNGVGEKSEPKTLTVTLVNDEDHEDPIIDKNESISVIAGGTAKTTLTGKHIRSWGHATLPDAIKDIDLKYDNNPNRCEVLVTASSTAKAGKADVMIYAYNAVGERRSATLSVTITEDKSYTDPKINPVNNNNIVSPTVKQ